MLFAVPVGARGASSTADRENPARSDVQDRGQRQGGRRGRQVRAPGEEEEEGGEGEAEGEKDGAELLTGWS